MNNMYTLQKQSC